MLALLQHLPALLSSFSLISDDLLDREQLDHVVTWQIEDFSCYLINAKETHEAWKL